MPEKISVFYLKKLVSVVLLYHDSISIPKPDVARGLTTAVVLEIRITLLVSKTAKKRACRVSITIETYTKPASRKAGIIINTKIYGNNFLRTSTLNIIFEA